MPQPQWMVVAVSVVLVLVIEWEEVASGYGPRSLLGHIVFAIAPVAYVAIAAWIFVAQPLAYAEKIRAAAAPVCANHRGLDESAVTVEHAAYRLRSSPIRGPLRDQITVRCNDGFGGSGEYTADGTVTLSPG